MVSLDLVELFHQLLDGPALILPLVVAVEPTPDLMLFPVGNRPFGVRLHAGSNKS